MRVNEGIRVLCGSIVVYIVVACGIAGERASSSWDAGPPSDAHHDAILDAVTDPVAEAHALLWLRGIFRGDAQVDYYEGETID
jgi:hypothetical protein